VKATVLRLLAIGIGIVLLASAYSKLHSPTVMSEAARAFLASLSPEERARATFQFADEERFNWHYIPKVRKGLPFKDMNSAQKHLAHALLSAGLSQRGYIKAITIMSLDEILKALEKGTGPVRDPEGYFLASSGNHLKRGRGATGLRVITSARILRLQTARSKARPVSSEQIQRRSAKARARVCGC